MNNKILISVVIPSFNRANTVGYTIESIIAQKVNADIEIVIGDDCSTDNTKNIILESAYFDPVSVRKSAKRIGVSTDASYRYERGIDPMITGCAVMRAAQIIIDMCGGKIINAYCAGSDKNPNTVIKYNPDYFAMEECWYFR